MDLKFEIEPIFKIEFFKIKCIKFKQKKKAIKEVLKKYPEIYLGNFFSNRNKANITNELLQIFNHEFMLINAKYNSKITSSS